MAIVVLVLWLFTAGAGLYLLVTGNPGRSRLASHTLAESASAGTATPAGTAAPSDPAASVAAPPQAAPPQAAPPQAAPPQAAPPQAAPPQAAPAQAAPAQLSASSAPPLSRRQMQRAERQRFDPPSLTASRLAPVLPTPRALLEFAHPACGLIGFGFWMGYTLVRYRMLGIIAFGLVAVTAGLGLSWFAANARAARRTRFSGRLVTVHGGIAAVTVVLAALAALVLRG